MESKKLKSVATKAVAKTIDESVKPNEMVADINDIRTHYGKCAILIKNNVVYRTSTRTSEKAPLSVIDLFLPNYGKMRKFVVREDGVYEIITTEVQKGTAFAQYTLSDKVAIDASKIDFNIDNVWNKAKQNEKAAK